MSKPPSLRARKQAATHEALYRAALSLFRARGFDATTVDEIAAAASVSRRTFFRYFDSKESVLFAKQPALMDGFFAWVREFEVKEGYDGFSAVRDAAIAFAPEFAAHRKESIVVQTIIDSSPGLTAADVVRDLQWEERVAGALAQGTLDPAALRRARYLAGAIVGMLRATTREWRRQDVELDLTEMIRENLEVLEFGAARWREIAVEEERLQA